MDPYSQPIFTLNARSNVMLEVIRDYFKLTSNTMHNQIQGMHLDTLRVLSEKGVPYEKLKAALVPTADRNEAGFIFDTQLIESPLYGAEVAEAILPLLDKRTTQSVLCGDLLGNDQEQICGILNSYMVRERSFSFVHGTLLYCVYINNLSDAALQKLHQGLSKSPAYLGYIPGTFQTHGKTYLSTTLVNTYLKYGDLVIMGHEDDRSNDENVNMTGYSFEENGYRVCSLQLSYFDLFLSYKIERAVYPGFEVDTEMSLNAVSRIVFPLEGFAIQLDDAKHEYLKTEKLGQLEKAGIENLDRDKLETLIEEKISANYIYNMAFLEEHNVIKFNIILEIPRGDGGFPMRLIAALEYKPLGGILRVITLY